MDRFLLGHPEPQRDFSVLWLGQGAFYILLERGAALIPLVHPALTTAVEKPRHEKLWGREGLALSHPVLGSFTQTGSLLPVLWYYSSQWEVWAPGVGCLYPTRHFVSQRQSADRTASVHEERLMAEL